MARGINSEMPTPESGLDLVTTCAALDPAFRASLLADPRSAIRSRFGVELPATLRIRFIERTPDTDLLIVLPDLLPTIAAEDIARFDRVLGGAGVRWDWGMGGYSRPGSGLEQ